MESLLQKAMAIGVHEVLEGQYKAQATGDQQNRADQIRDFLLGVLADHV